MIGETALKADPYDGETELKEEPEDRRGDRGVSEANGHVFKGRAEVSLASEKHL